MAMQRMYNRKESFTHPSTYNGMPRKTLFVQAVVNGTVHIVRPEKRANDGLYSVHCGETNYKMKKYIPKFIMGVYHGKNLCPECARKAGIKTYTTDNAEIVNR